MRTGAPARTGSPIDLVVVGASLGGIDALRRVFNDLPANWRTPIAVVQHRRLETDSQLAGVLAGRTGLEVVEPEDREPIRPGRIYLAPGGYHLLVEPGRFSLSVDPPVTYARPSIDVLFESAAIAYGRRLVAVLLTASSEDGAAGIAAVVAHGGIPVVEDPQTARSPVAPLAALARARVEHVLPVERIGGRLAEICAETTLEELS